MRRNHRPARRRAAAVTSVIVALAAVGLAGGCGGPAPSASPTAPPASLASPSTGPSVPPTSPAASPTAEVRIFFVPGGADPCGTVSPVVRKVAGPVTAEIALRELLAGPTAEEVAAGFTSLFGPATADALLEVVVADGIARVSFRDLRQIIPNASSSCGSAALLGALDATLAQLPGIRGARYSFGGDEAAFYEWLQMAPPD
jgi:spore germination protein GerM